MTTKAETVSENPDTAPAAVYCGRCGKPLDEDVHAACPAGLELEPPRYCARCARRMVVQVVPTGWAARCSVHGSVNAPARR